MTTKNYIPDLLERIRKTESGATLKNYVPVHYESGYQYSKTENGADNATRDIKAAAAMIESLRGTCGVWYDGGVFYIETSYHENDYSKAIETARKYHQLSVYDWKNDAYIKL
jgi:hypothetical protein